MNRFGIAIAATLAAGVVALAATEASAQSWGYDEHQADRAYQSADIRDAQAWHDQREAAAAAYWGDYGAADQYARAADRHRYQAWKDARYARREQRAARWNYWTGGWGY